MINQIDNIDLIKSVAFTFLTFFIVLVTLVVFVYLSRKKMLAQRLKTKELELQIQKDVVNIIINTQEQERSRIARDLHDDISSKLNAVSMSIHLLKRDTLSNSDRAEISDNTLSACQLIAESSRRIAHNLMPPTLENVGLHLAIEELCKNFSTAESIAICYSNPMEQELFQHLSMEHQIHLYRIIQELINNSIRHAKASEIKLWFEYTDQMATFIYTDNGPGITNYQLTNNGGIGLRNIYSRADMIQAVPHFHTNEVKGFKFTLKFNNL